MLAYVDSFVGGLVPCKIVGEAEETDYYTGPRRWFKVQITANRRGYARGITYNLPASAVVPRDAVYRSRQRCGQYMIRPHDWNVLLPRNS